MKKMILAMSLGLGLIAAPALYACDAMDKADHKAMKESKASLKTQAKKAVKSGQKTVEKKSQTSKS